MTRDDSEAQKSPVHETTEDATSEPSFRGRVQPAAPGSAPADTGTPRTAKPGASSPPPSPPPPGHVASSMPPAPPASNFERGAADRDIELTVNQPGDNAPVNPNEPELPAGPGAADADSGAGAGAGIPGGGTDMRLAGKPRPGNLQQDRDRVLGPGAGSGAPSRAPDENAEADPNLPGAHVVSDESSFGGPVRIDTDEQKDRR